MPTPVEKIDDLVEVNNVLISVSNKDGLDFLVPALLGINPRARFYASGGTYKSIQGFLEHPSAQVIRVEDYTGQPETEGGLVKTLDWKVHLGILTEKYNDSHQRDIQRTESVQFDMVVVNFYPFQDIVSQGATPEVARITRDIGGPTMVSGAAKNHIRTAVVVDPIDYTYVVGEMHRNNGRISFATRFNLGKKAIKIVENYYRAMREYYEGISPEVALRGYPEVVRNKK